MSHSSLYGFNNNSVGAAAQASELTIAHEAAEREGNEFHVDVATDGDLDNVDVADVMYDSGEMVAAEAEEMVAVEHGGLVYQTDAHYVEASDVAIEETNVSHSQDAFTAFQAERLSLSEVEALISHAPNEADGPLDESSDGRDSADPQAGPLSKKAKLELTPHHDGPVIPSDSSSQDGHANNDSYQHVLHASNTEEVATHDTSSHRKPRKEFTAAEKLAILSELDAPDPPSIKDLLAKYGLSKSSFHRWRSPQVKERLVEMARSGEEQDVDVPMSEESERDAAPATSAQLGELVQAPPPSLLYKGNKKRDMSDGLLPLKRSLQQFIEFNASLPQEEQYAIRSAFLQAKARELRNELVRKAEERELEIERWKIHQEQRQQDQAEFPNDQNDGSTNENDNDSNPCPPPLLTTYELKSLQNFKGSKSWSCQIASQLGLLTAPWSEASEANSRKYLEEAATASSGSLVGAVDVKKPKKARMEFTALDKVRILKEIDENNKQRKNEGLPILTVEEICERYGTSKSSLHRWRQQHKSGQLDAVLEEGSTDVKRIFKDKLSMIKGALAEFVAGQEKVGYFMLQSRALEVRDELLKGYEEGLKSGSVEGMGVEAAAGVVEGIVVTEDVHVKEEANGSAVSTNQDESVLRGETTVAPTALEDVGVEDATGDMTCVVVTENVKVKEEEDGAAVSTCRDECLLPGETAVAFTNGVEGALPDIHVCNTDKGHTTTAETNVISLAASKLTEDEYQALRNFKASMSWLREVAKKYNWTMDSTDDTKVTENWRLDGRRALHEHYYQNHHNHDEEQLNVVVQEQLAHDRYEEVHQHEIAAEVVHGQLQDERVDDGMPQEHDHNEVHYDLVMAEVEQPPSEDYELQVAEILECTKICRAIDRDVSRQDPNVADRSLH